jgi:phospholipase C
MKLSAISLLCLIVLATTPVDAQNPFVQNIIVVIQENRTPDNLFQDPVLKANGADIIDPNSVAIQCCVKNSNGTCSEHQVPLRSLPLASCANPDHSHGGWKNMYNGGQMDGACNHGTGSCNPYPCPFDTSKNCSQYTYVDKAAVPIQPYWDIAEKYGFANYMFQTSQGPSFPAHQFLLSGTSAPTGNINPLYSYFAAENVEGGNNSMQNAGCAASSAEIVKLISPAQDELTTVYPCFDHPTLTDLLDQNGIGWRWYGDQEKSIWTAPNAISHICNNSLSGGGGNCGSGTGSNHDWNNYVKPFLERAIRTGYTPTLAPFLQDLQNCNFPNSGSVGGVYFVVPDGRWSDHPVETIGLGPNYVANIVNLVGRSPAQGGCPSPKPNWSNTVVLITWDDWGGWYDHVNPISTIGQGSPGYPNGGGNGVQYVYGFRVPLLVVSTFAKQHYISGPKTSPIYYDFGSILKFVEETFLSSTTEINPIYPYADHFISGQNDLSDFFDCFGQQCHPFQPITLVNNSQYCNHNACGSNQCDVACFINYSGDPRDPDDE